MNNSQLTLPVITLPVFLLPEGITRLRIFEPKYLNMVKIATKEQGFLILFKSNEANNETNNTNFDWGSWVNIINFDQGSDGILEIDVQCKSLVEILSTGQSAHSLNFCQVKPLPHWSQETYSLPKKSLSDPLLNVFKKHLTLDQLYTKKKIDNENWVIARWLELLPVKGIIKNSFVKEHSFEEAKKFVESIIFNDGIK